MSDQRGLDDAAPDDATTAGATRQQDGPEDDGVRARGMKVLAGDDFSLADAVGGVRGVVESVLPGLVFVVIYVAVRELTPALVASLAAALVAVVIRLVQRTPVTQALGGVLGIGIGVVWAWRSGEAQNFFAWGIWVNVAWCAGALLSILLRWPFIGVVVSLLRGEGMDWRTGTDDDARGLRRRYTWATWIWVVLFGGRLAVQLPLYLRGEEAVGWLGAAKLAMGVPLFALALWLTWLLVRAPAAAPAPPRPPHDR